MALPTREFDKRVFRLESGPMSHRSALNHAQFIRRDSRLPKHGNRNPMNARVAPFEGKWGVWTRPASR